MARGAQGTDAGGRRGIRRRADQGQGKQDKEPKRCRGERGPGLPSRKPWPRSRSPSSLPSSGPAIEISVEKRDEHRKRVALRNLLVELEHELRLTAEQRDKLGESLATHWDPALGSAGSFLDEERIFPEIPDPVIVPFLTETQKAAWKSSRRGHGVRPGR